MSKNIQNTEAKKVAVNFSALQPYVEENIVQPTEKEVRGQKFIEQGTNNLYPQYLFELYQKVPTLQTIINGIADYVVGDGVKSNLIGITDEDAENLVKHMAISYSIFGGIYLNVLRNRLGGIAQVNCLDARNVRTDSKNEWFYYSEDFCKKSYGRCKYLSYPKFDTEAKNIASSIYYCKNGYYNTYGLPIYASASVACEIEKLIDEFHINSIKNGFSSNVLVSFNNGVPTDEVRQEIEEMFYEKFTGNENAGMPLINFADDKEHSVTVEKLDTDSFSDRYEALAKRCQQEIFTAFRANPNLFGINTENNGFAEENFMDAFKLLNRTTIKPIQKIIINILNKIYEVDNSIEIKPFSIDWSEDAKEQTIE